MEKVYKKKSYASAKNESATSSSSTTTLNAQVCKFKESGNKFFMSGLYSRAIYYYNKAIEAQPNCAPLYTNRALCNLRLGEQIRVLDDCRAAMELDPNSIKAHYYSGQALLEMGQMDEAVMRLSQAREMALSQHKNFGDDISMLIRMAKRARYEKEARNRGEEKRELFAYLESLIIRDNLKCRDGQTDELRKTNEENDKKQQEETGNFVPTLNEQTEIVVSNQENDHKEEDIISPKGKRLIEELRLVFEEDESKKLENLEVPEYLCGKISLSLLRDPVVAPSGITYERANIVDHLQRVGHFDPITRTKLTSEMLIPNMSMREVVDAFLDKNKWAELF